jgi:hypothetical protein
MQFWFDSNSISITFLMCSSFFFFFFFFPNRLKNFPGMLPASIPELGEVELPSIQLRDFPGVALPTAGLASFRLPGCKLGKIPGINLPLLPKGPSAPNAPMFDMGSLDIPSFCLGDVPGINLSEIQMQLQAGKLQLADLQLPALKLHEFLLPRMSLAIPTGPEFEIPALRASLGAVELPSFSLGAAFPNLDFSVATSFFSLEAPKIPVIGGNVSMDSIELPEIQLSAFPDLDLGGSYPELDGMLLGSLDFSAMNITLPPITLADLPNFDVLKITAQLRAGAVDMPSLRLPPLQLQDFPGIKLPDVGAELTTFPSGMVLDLGKITLPSVSLDQFTGLALPGAGLSSFKLPKCRLQDFPEIKLPPLPQGLELPDGFDLGTIEIPSFRLGQIPNFDLPKLSLQLQAGELRLPELRLPELRLDGDFLLPEIELLLKIRFKFNLRLKGARLPDFEKLWDGLSQWLKQVELPSFELGQFPQLQVPDWDWGQMPDLDFLPDANVSMKLPDIPDVTIRMPDMPEFDFSLPTTVPSLHLENPLGGLMMKFKLLLGFGQVLSYFAITFSSIPWGPRFTSLFKFFELFSFDIFGFFGATSCQLQTGFLEKFGFHVCGELLFFSSSCCYFVLFLFPSFFLSSPSAFSAPAASAFLRLLPLLLFLLLLFAFLFSAFSVISLLLSPSLSSSLSPFLSQMALIPVILGLLAVAYLLATCRVRKPDHQKNKQGTKFTKESAKSAFFKLTSLLLYTVYVGVSTRIFRLFKCADIQGTWYLTSDYTVTCFEGKWNTSSSIAYVCMVIFVIGIPLGQFLVLHYNRAYIDEAACMDSIVAHRRHIRVMQQYGSLFKDYSVQCYYYDIIDLLRRLVLTGGLIMVGGDGNSVAQVCSLFFFLFFLLQSVCVDLKNFLLLSSSSLLLLFASS